MIQTDEQVQEIVDQFLDVFKGRKSLDIETVRGALKSMAINVRDGMKEHVFQFIPPTEEQFQERINKIDNALSYEKLGFKWGAEWMLNFIKDQKESFELGKCECGQEHDIRFMATDSEGNHICYECYTSWVATFSKHVRELLKLRAAQITDKNPSSYVEITALIDKIGEDYTNCGKGWEQIVNEDWEEENPDDHTKGDNE